MNSTLEQMMSELRAEYLASFPQKFTEIASHLEARDFLSLRNDFHKLKGTGKTYGIPEISELCAVVEKICLNAAATTAPNAEATIVGVALSLLHRIVECRKSGQQLNLAELQEFNQVKGAAS